jgi:hypothetical protein
MRSVESWLQDSCNAAFLYLRSGSALGLVSSPERDGCSERDGGEEDLRAAVIARGNRRQSLSLPNMISIQLRRLLRRLSCLTGLPRDFRPGVKGDQI